MRFGAATSTSSRATSFRLGCARRRRAGCGRAAQRDVTSPVLTARSAGALGPLSPAPRGAVLDDGSQRSDLRLTRHGKHGVTFRPNQSVDVRVLGGRERGSSPGPPSPRPITHRRRSVVGPALCAPGRLARSPASSLGSGPVAGPESSEARRGRRPSCEGGDPAPRFALLTRRVQLAPLLIDQFVTGWRARDFFGLERLRSRLPLSCRPEFRAVDSFKARCASFASAGSVSHTERSTSRGAVARRAESNFKNAGKPAKEADLRDSPVKRSANEPLG